MSGQKRGQQRSRSALFHRKEWRPMLANSVDISSCFNLPDSFSLHYRPMLADLWPSHCQWAPLSVPGEPEGGAPDLRATHCPSPRSPLRSHLAGALLSGLHPWTALLGAGGVQALGLPRGKQSCMFCLYTVSCESGSLKFWYSGRLGKIFWRGTTQHAFLWLHTVFESSCNSNC